MDQGFFETVRDAFEGFVVAVPGQRNTYVHNRGLKAWFDDDTREHYEAQLIRVDGTLQLEVGFHAEHPKAPLNDAVLQLEELPMMAIGTEIILVESEGTEAVRGTFKGIPNGGLFTASKQLFRIYSQTKTCIWANRVECQDRGKQLVPETLWARAAEPS